MNNNEVAIKNLLIKINTRYKDFCENADKEFMFKKFEENNNVNLKKKSSYLLLIFSALFTWYMFSSYDNYMATFFSFFVLIASVLWLSHTLTFRSLFNGNNGKKFYLEEFRKTKVEQSFFDGNKTELSYIKDINYFKNYTYQQMYDYLESLLP